MGRVRARKLPTMTPTKCRKKIGVVVMADKMEMVEKHGFKHPFYDERDMTRQALVELEARLKDRFFNMAWRAAEPDLMCEAYRLYGRAAGCSEVVSAIDAALSDEDALCLDDALYEHGTLSMVESRLRSLKAEMGESDAIFNLDIYVLIEMWSRGETLTGDEERPRTGTRAEDVLLDVCLRYLYHKLEVRQAAYELAGDATSMASGRGLACADVDDDCALGLLHEAVGARLRRAFPVRNLIDSDGIPVYAALVIRRYTF